MTAYDPKSKYTPKWKKLDDAFLEERRDYGIAANYNKIPEILRLWDFAAEEVTTFYKQADSNGAGRPVLINRFDEMSPKIVEIATKEMFGEEVKQPRKVSPITINPTK